MYRFLVSVSMLSVTLSMAMALRAADVAKAAKPARAASTPAPATAVQMPTGGSATPGPVVPSRGTPPGGPPGSTPVKPSADPSGKPTGPPGSKPPGTNTGTKPGSTKPEPVKPLQRPAKPPTPPDPTELDVKPDQRGLIRFQFRGQPWPDVLEWLGQISNMSIDWQELPGDYINLSTQRGYKVAEVRDLLNRLLLARGYTMLQQDESVVVVKCDALSVAMVPRVAARDLADCPPHEFVRVQFPLDRLLAEDIAEELKPLLSKNGKLSALRATNRLEVMDAVINVLEIQRILDEEQGDAGASSHLVREFVLQYARAEDVHKSLAEFIGLATSAPTMSKGMTPQQLAQQQAMMRAQQMQAQAAQHGQPSKTPAVTVKPKSEPVHMLVNRNRNSILAQATPDKMAVIAEAIKLIDVPPEGAQSLQAILGRMKVYRLAQLDPRKLVDTLNEVGGLDPTTRLEADDVNKAIIAYATPADHFTIQATIEKLDSSARKIEVIPLRRLAADEVAGTIQYLMVGQRAEKKTSRSSYYGGYYGGYNPYGRSSTPESTDEFRVEADVENNRLLVRANDTELEEVVSILVKLGEITRPDSAQGSTRVLEIEPGDTMDKFLEQLQDRWQRVAPNPLILPESKPATDKSPANPATDTSAPKPADAELQSEPQPSSTAVQLAMAVAPAMEKSHSPAPSSPPKPKAAPIVIAVNRDGQIVISSRDPEALDMLETLATQMAPPKKSYKVYHLKYASASWVALNLEDFFKEDDSKDKSNEDRFMGYIYGIPSSSSNSDSAARRLSKRRSLAFISDIDTNTIIVKNADSSQLSTIDELIEVYDVPEPLSSQTARITRLFPIQFSKASVVAETIKDAYRDLLSSNDKAFRQQGKQQQSQRTSSGMTYLNPFGGASQPQDRSQTQVRFKGKLSLGIDDVSNTLLVTTEGESLMEVIEQMIAELDRAAAPVSQMQVIKVGMGTDWSRLQQTLSKVVGQQTKTPPPRASRQETPTRPGQPTRRSSSRSRPSKR